MMSEGRPEAAGNYQVWATPADYQRSTGNQIASFGESPLLAAQVAAGELPPVDQRLPAEPLVVRGFDGRAGSYGGVLTEYNVWDSAGNAPQLVWTRMPINGYWPLYEPYPAIIKSYEMTKDDGTEWVFVLREGLKWSDGHPLTADDFLFPFNDVAMNAELTPRSWPELKVGDTTATIARENDYQVRYSFPQAYRFTHINPWFRWYIPKPSHYLKQFHADYVEQDALDKLVKEGGFETWIQLYSNCFADSNIDRPTVKPWMDGNVAHLISTGASNLWSPKWADWHLSGGAEGEQPNALMMEAIEYYSKAQSSMDLEEQKLWFKKVLDIAADNLWTIGILAPQTGVTVTLPNLVNYPTACDMALVAVAPMGIRLIDAEGRLRAPFVYSFEKSRDPVTLALVYQVDSATGHPLRLFVRGDPYKLWGLWDGDEQGRDLLHRRQGGGLHGARDHVPAPGAVVPEPHHRVGNAGDPVDDLGIGLQPPAISWGVLLKAAQNVKAIVATPWLPSPTRRPAG